jgi:hypothetical protein
VEVEVEELVLEVLTEVVRLVDWDVELALVLLVEVV